MGQKNNEQAISVPASGDLSSDQYKFVVINSSGQLAVVSAAGGDADGVLADKPSAAGRAGKLVYGGKTKVLYGGSVTAGEKLQSNASGQAITAALGDHVLGKALVDGSSGDVGEILLVSKHILA